MAKAWASTRRAAGTVANEEKSPKGDVTMIRTPQQYIESLNDGRVLYFMGERVPDVTKHPIIKRAINAAAMDWILANHPKYRDLLTMEEDGERIMFLWKQPKSAEDLVRRRDIFVTCCRIGMGAGSVLHAMGIDALAAAGVVAKRMDERLGTHYMDAVEDYRKHLKKTDPGITGAITDVKGDRSLRPSKQEQHKDFYVRVVDKQKNGIIVRGAKFHISSTPVANEIIVSPCRAHREEDKDYAVVFATPLNAKGIKLILSPPPVMETGEEAEWDWPICGRGGGGGYHYECLIVFDDVFVPWNRVFMCGEWQFSRDIAWTFGVFHRLFGSSHEVALLEAKAGAATLIAEYNGLDKYPHIQEKLAWLAMHAEICEILSRAACEHPDIDPDTGLVAPNLVYTNIAKYMFANDSAEASKRLADICGGIVSDCPSYRDWMNPEERPFIEKYLAGKAGIPTEHRLRMIRLIKDMTGHDNNNTNIHAEGSLAAQIIALYASGDWARYKAAAKRMAGIPGWKEHPVFKDLLDYPSRLI